ncbi:putative endo-1,3(4)-beta-glucanase [Rosa chinensis]|uniref:glucan endo-1,3-beta-D-glucosidase n=1 Tax=Rosa chinensis TaxID=74649 RepID=A0A2P6RG42_ROSCH|nr:putative endo-1,3(4)-beta-glucanase [Rosa chinensis]
MKYKPQAYSFAADFMNLIREEVRNQESTSEVVNANYSTALLGLAYGDTDLMATGSMLAALEIQAAQMWCHVREGDNIYAPDYTKESRVVGVLLS